MASAASLPEARSSPSSSSRSVYVSPARRCMEEPSTAVHAGCTVIVRSGEASSNAVSAVMSLVVLAISIGSSAFFSARTAPDPAW